MIKVGSDVIITEGVNKGTMGTLIRVTKSQMCVLETEQGIHVRAFNIRLIRESDLVEVDKKPTKKIVGRKQAVDPDKTVKDATNKFIISLNRLGTLSSCCGIYELDGVGDGFNDYLKPLVRKGVDIKYAIKNFTTLIAEYLKDHEMQECAFILMSVVASRNNDEVVDFLDALVKQNDDSGSTKSRLNPNSGNKIIAYLIAV